MGDTYLQPAGDHVLVVDKERSVTIDGIDLPSNVKQQEMVFGFVVAVGPLAADRVTEKEIVCYGPYAGKNVSLDGVEFRLLREGQIEAWVRQKQEPNPTQAEMFDIMRTSNYSFELSQETESKYNV